MIFHEQKRVDGKQANTSKYNFRRESQVILLMILNCEKCYIFQFKKLFAVLNGLISKYQGDCYCLSCFHLFRTKNELDSNENVRKGHYCFRTKMPDKKIKCPRI